MNNDLHLSISRAVFSMARRKMRRACGRPLHVCNMAHVGLAIGAFSWSIGRHVLPSRLYAVLQGYRWLRVLDTLPPDPFVPSRAYRHSNGASKRDWG
jgi:hypothetical protein